MMTVRRAELFARSEHEQAAIFLPMITEGEAQVGRRRLSIVNRREVGLLVFQEFLVRDIVAVEIHLPIFGKRTQRDAGIVLDYYPGVIEQKIANAGETLGMHQVGSGLEKAIARALAGAPFQERARAAGKVGFEIVQGLVRAAPRRERDPHAL